MSSSRIRQTILITGGSGFIGRNLLEMLPKKYKLLAPTHKDLDLLDNKKVEKYFLNHSIDIVIHCSNIGGTRDTYDLPNVALINLKIFFNIIRCKNRFKKMIFLGSGAEYDKSRQIKKIKEQDFDEYIPIDEYGFYKYVCSKYIQNEENIINLRLFAVYGRYENYKLRFISYALCRNILGLPIIINQNVVFEYLYIKDLVKIIEFFINNETQEKFVNVGRGVGIDLLTIANLINSLADKKVKIIVKKRGFQNEYTCDNSRLLELIPGFEFTDFKTSLKEMYNYYNNIRSSLLTN